MSPIYVSLQSLSVVWIFLGSWVSFSMKDKFLVRVTKDAPRISVPSTQSLPFWSYANFKLTKLVVLSKLSIPHNFESHNFPKLPFTNIQSLSSNFAGCESFLELKTPDIFALCKTNVEDLLILAISLWGILLL